MKRDMDLIRSMLLRFEASDHERNSPKLLDDLASKEEIGFHLRLLKDGGFVDESIVQPFPSGASYHFGWRMTSAGHDFLDNIRDPDVWRRTKAGAGQLGGWSMRMLADLAAGYVREKAKEIGLPLG